MLLSLAAPITVYGTDTGKDWYCSNPKEHAKYEKHLQRHLDNSADVITEKLDKIYSNPALSNAEKKAKTLKILEKYLSKMKAGVGD